MSKCLTAVHAAPSLCSALSRVEQERNEPERKVVTKLIYKSALCKRQSVTMGMTALIQPMMMQHGLVSMAQWPSVHMPALLVKLHSQYTNAKSTTEQIPRQKPGIPGQHEQQQQQMSLVYSTRALQQTDSSSQVQSRTTVSTQLQQPALQAPRPLHTPSRPLRC